MLHWHSSCNLIITQKKGPRSIYQYSNMTPRLSGQNCKFLKSLLSLNSRLTLLICITIKSSMYVRQFRTIFVVLARNCLASTLDCIVMQMKKINREKGYSQKRLRYKENNIKYRSLSWKPRSHVGTLIYRTLPIVTSLEPRKRWFYFWWFLRNNVYTSFR